MIEMGILMMMYNEDIIKKVFKNIKTNIIYINKNEY